MRNIPVLVAVAACAIVAGLAARPAGPAAADASDWTVSGSFAAAPPPSAPITSQRLPASNLTGPAEDGAGAQQEIVVRVAPGPLSVSPASISLELRRARAEDTYTATLPEIRVVDARGSLAGWVARVGLDDASLKRAHVQLVPTDARVVDGLPRGLHTDAPVDLDGRSSGAVCDADQQWSGGTFACGGRIDVDPVHGHPRHLTIELRITVS
jgi:hypothetical protein